MGAEDQRTVVRDLRQVVHEHGALGGQLADHTLVVDDLVAHVDRRAPALQRPLDDVDRACHARAEPARRSHDDLHISQSSVATKRGRWRARAKSAAACGIAFASADLLWPLLNFISTQRSSAL